jgi:cytochrome c oxidase cbb3-type subunit 3
MKSILPVLRIIALVAIAFALIEFLIPTGGELAVFQHPILLLVLAVVILVAIAIEISVAALGKILFKSLNAEAREIYLKKESENEAKLGKWFEDLSSKLTSVKPIETEGEILLDHDYDGIQELDNDLPPWWKYGFYATIIAAFAYVAYFHVFGGNSQKEEYQIEMAKAELAVEEYKKNAPDLVDANSVVLLTEEADLNVGKQIFLEKCFVCHRADAGGAIGPNLTDEYWIFAGDISTIFNTISEGGRPGKGMISWKQDLKPLERAQVGSYILSLQGSNPPNPKAPDGDLWLAEEAL